MRKVTISNRSVYHKYVEVTIEVPDDIVEAEVDSWLWKNEEIWSTKLDEKLSATDYEFGTGLADDHDGMCEYDAESETRYDLKDKDDKNLIGGHL